ncbi:SGNH/GDSL hydrolase family protein [soil metagenome]
MKTYSYLALGDSYTIGEQVPLADSFPYQTIQQLRKMGMLEATGPTTVGVEYRRHVFAAPEIVAKTGWTTDELSAAIGQTVFLSNYDIVSLLIGVNNQYRGRTVAEFEHTFELLLQLAIQFAAGISANVYVLSIPDWGLTPFAKDREAKSISTEIDAYNKVCETIASNFKVHFINITDDQRTNVGNVEFLAVDGLHPSAKEYQKWAGKLSQLISANIR